MRYNIIPKDGIAMEVNANSEAEAMQIFACKMDFDMNTYFRATKAVANDNMKRFRVPVEVLQYHGVYVYAKNEKQAVKIVKEMIEDGTVEFDDDGDGDICVADGIIDEIDEDGEII